MRKLAALILLPALAILGLHMSAPADAVTRTSKKAIPFEDARLKIEYNATDGDAGLQVFVDADAWADITITNPDGEPVIDVEADDVIENYGLTELFSESSEPPFDEFPFSEFKELFPAGTYTFTGHLIDGTPMKSRVKLTHKVPGAPVITAPAFGATVPPSGVVVDWNPVTTPVGVKVVAYEVLVVDDAPSLGNPTRVLDAMLPASATRMSIPPEFLLPGSYKTEVLAIEASGNQTLTEVEFSVS